MVAYKIQPLKEQRFTELATYVRLGKLSDKCKGFGICEIQALAQSDYQGKTAYKKVVCHISRINASELVFSFFPKTMAAEQRDFFFDRPDFIVGEDVELDETISQSLGLEGFRIKKGVYKKYVVGSAHNLIFSSA